MFYNQRYIGDYIIRRFQREYLERWQVVIFGLLATGRLITQRLGMTYALLSSCTVDIMYHILRLWWMVR